MSTEVPNSILVLTKGRGFSEEEYLAVLREAATKHGRAVDVLDTLSTPAEQLRWAIRPWESVYGWVIVDASTTDYYIQAEIPDGVRDSFRLVYRNRLGHPYGDFRDAVNCLLKIDPDHILSGGEFDIHGHLIV